MTNTPLRLPILALGIFALLAAMWGGLVRLGWPFPSIVPGLTGIHGPLMVSGFLGTLISLERAVALRAPWAFVAPMASAVGTLILVTGISPAGGASLVTLGSLVMLAVFMVIVRRLPALYTYTMALGAVAWFFGNVIWLAGLPVFRVVLWWSGFLVLTVVGERLELARLQRIPRAAERLYLLAVVILLAAMLVDAVEGLAFPEMGTNMGVRLAGVSMVGLALWLWRYDIARRTVRQTGLMRFIALCLLSGYIWMGLSGLLRMLSPEVIASGPYYDAVLHTLFLGFIMSMIFGHAPIIFPAVLGRAMPYSPLFYAHLILLHGSLLVRLVGDLGGGLRLRQWGGMLNVIAVLLFLFATGRAVLSAAARRTT